jgi:hypothetical protein
MDLFARAVLVIGAVTTTFPAGVILFVRFMAGGFVEDNLEAGQASDR